MANIRITVGNRGIGFFMVQRLLAKGHKVGFVDLEMDRLQINLHSWYILCNMKSNLWSDDSV